MMKLFDLFTHQHIQDVLNKTFSLSDKCDISFSVDNSSVIDNCTTLNVINSGVEQKYVIVKVPKTLENEEKPSQINSNVLYPVFTIGNNKECYAAFESQHGLDDFVSPEQNNTECLKLILQNLAQHQASDLANNEEVKKPSEYNLKDITQDVTSLDFFKNLDTTLVNESIDKIQLALNKLIDGSKLLVGSIGCPFAKNVYVNQKINKSIFLKISSTKVVPPVYDALLYIFALSDEKFRQEHFEDLIVYYFESLVKSLNGLESSISATITRAYSEHETRILLPVVKFKIVNSFLKLENPPKNEDILTNLFNFLKYPLVNQEDIYEAAKNKLGSSDYVLLDYSLVSLSEKNGHLGEYFHLNIKIKAHDKEEQLKLFAKILITSTEFMKDIIESGPAKKEDFFYRILIPLYTKYGLDSILDFAPKCYLSRINWLLILDDLSREGYVGLKPNRVLGYEGLRLSVENLAKFHASTIILEEMLSKESGKIVRLDQEYGEYLFESLLVYEEGHPLKAMYDNTVESLYYVVEKFPEATKKLNSSTEELRARLRTTFMAVFSKVKNSEIIRKVINHGDMYVANMLFKFDKDEIPIRNILIDFQLLRYACPHYDLLFFLFENSTKTTRDKYFKELIEDYYYFISENIKKFNFDPEVILPKSLYDESIQYMMSAGVIGAFMYAHVIQIDPDFREEIFHDEEKSNYYLNEHKSELIDISLKVEHYRTIIKGLVEDIVDVIEREF